MTKALERVKYKAFVRDHGLFKRNLIGGNNGKTDLYHIYTVSEEGICCWARGVEE